MRAVTLFTSILLIFFFTQSSAQNAEQIIDRYLERVGGEEMLKNIKGMTMTGTFLQSGLEIPIKQVIMTDGRQYLEMSFAGKQIKQQVYDGETLWSENFSTGKAEISDEEATYNFRLNLNDFPDALLNYEKKGYEVAFAGTVTKQGKETYKIRVKRENTKVDGEEKENIVCYFIDVESGLSIFQESEDGNKSETSTTSTLEYSNYQLVEGKYLMPFNVVQKVNGQEVFQLLITKVELDPEVSDEEFKFPG